MRSLETLNFNLLELLGKGYIIEHYVSLFSKEIEEEAYRNYVTDALFYAVNNTAHKEGDMLMTVHYSELIKPKTQKEIQEDVQKEEQKANDIISDIRRKMRKL